MGTFNKQIVFEGAATALITPMKNGLVDYDAFGKLIDVDITANNGMTGHEGNLRHFLDVVLNGAKKQTY